MTPPRRHRRWQRALATAVAAALVLAPSTSLGKRNRGIEAPVQSSEWPDRYDRHFRKYAKHYFGPGFDWHWFKAQAIAESRLNPKARSRVGARGLMQITPATFKEIRSSNPHYEHIDEPRWNIAAGVYYMRYLYDRWGPEDLAPPLQNRLAFTFASYNAGFGGTRKAMRKAKKRGLSGRRWSEVGPQAPRETRTYVKRINKLMGR